MSRVFLAIAGAALAMTALPGSATASSAREWRQIRVDASALDLSEPRGIEELERRIARAVSRICGSDSDCRDEAWASTEPQVAWAIERDETMRRLAEERAAQLRACGWQGCAPEPVYYAPPPPLPPVVATGGVVVTIVYAPAYPAPGWR